jgi:pimeloyl-ACP methyl ester carboxylesterase
MTERGVSRSKRRRRIGRALSGGALLSAASLSACVMTRPAHTPPLAPPSDLAVRPVSFASGSGATIRGWYLPGMRGGGAVLLLHGVGSNRSSMVGRARFLHRQGYSVLLPDFQAHGESGGEFITFGSLESFDAAAALDYLRQCSGGERVAAIGISMGGAAALLGPGPLHVDALVLESVYPTIRQALEDRLAVWMGPFGRLNRYVAPVVLRGVSAEIGVPEEALRPIDRIGSAVAPLFLLSGTRDAYTPIAEARALYEQARGPKEFWAVEGAKHEDLYAFTGEVYERRVGGFLAAHLRAPVAATVVATRSVLPDRPPPACGVPSAEQESASFGGGR